MNVEKILAFAMVCSALLLLLRHYRPEQGLLLSVAASILLLVWIFRDMQPLLDSLKQLAAYFQLGEERIQVLLKSLGICLLSQMAADVCRDAGEGSLASKVELAGKSAVLLLCLPLYQELLALAADLIW